MKWEFLADLPRDWEMLSSGEVASLVPIWQEHRAAMQENAPELRQFLERQRREWAIETGIIEDLYSIDRGTTQLLIEEGISASLIPHGATDKPVDLVVAILRDQEAALEGVFDFVAGRRELTSGYICELHALLTKHQETVSAVDPTGRPVEVEILRGRFKELPNNPTRRDGTMHEYCPPVHVVAEMERLLELHRQHEQDGVPADVEAAWLHHRFTQIHPFQDGNGRVARALVSLVFLRAGWFPLVIHRDIREPYIQALEEADCGDLRPLTVLFVRVQKTQFVQALSISRSVLQEQATLHEVIAAASERLRARHEAQLEERRKVFDLAHTLWQRANRRVGEVARTLEPQLKPFDPTYFAIQDSSDAERSHGFVQDAIRMAKHFGYFADLNTYRAWTRLKIREERQTDLVISFHSLGIDFVGVMVATAFIEHRERREDDDNIIDGPYPVCDAIFQFAYNEAQQMVRNRFDGWLNDVLVRGLDQWRRQI